MIERHYDDEALIAFLEPGATADAHLPSCAECTGKLDTLRLVTEALADSATWDPRTCRDEPVPQTIATLRAFADRMAYEDTQAEIYLRDLLAGPRDSWMPKLREHPEYRTAGVVRKLIAACDRAIDTMPPDAVEITALATEITEHLDPAAHTSDTVAKLRGAAWRERAYALFYTGQFADAEKAVFASESHFSDCLVGEYETARVGIVRALVERSQEDTRRSLTTARTIAPVLERFGDMQRHVSARSAEAAVVADTGNYTAALRLWLSLEATFSPDDSTDAHARLLSNIAYAYRCIGEVDNAIRYFQDAATIFATQGNVSEALRIRWNIASMLVEGQRLGDAALQLQVVLAEFEKLEMRGAAVDVLLHLAEVKLLQNRPADVPPICRAAMEHLAGAGLSFSARGLTAIAYLREAAAARQATQQLVQHVRTYVKRLPEEPTLLFAPPPP